MNVLLLCHCIRYEGHTQSAECGQCLTAITGDSCGDNHVFVPQKYACRDKNVMSRPYLCGNKYLSRQKYFVATNVILSRQNLVSILLLLAGAATIIIFVGTICCDKHVFDTTKVLSRQT